MTSHSKPTFRTVFNTLCYRHISVPALLLCKQTILGTFQCLPSPDLFDGRMTDAPRPTFWLDGVADRCISGTALILFFSGSHVSDPALNILIYCISVS